MRILKKFKLCLFSLFLAPTVFINGISSINQTSNLSKDNSSLTFDLPDKLDLNFTGAFEKTTTLEKKYSYSTHTISGSFIPKWKVSLSKEQLKPFIDNNNYSCSLKSLWNNNVDRNQSNIVFDFDYENNNLLYWKEKNWGASSYSGEGYWKNQNKYTITPGAWDDWKTYSTLYKGRCQPFQVINYTIYLKFQINEENIFLHRINNKLYFETNVSDSNSFSVYIRNSDKSKNYSDLGWKSTKTSTLVYDYSDSYIDRLQRAFDVNNIINIDKDKTKWWMDVETNEPKIHPTISANVDYLESCLGSWQTQYFARDNNWLKLIQLPDNARQYLNAHEEVINVFSEALISGLLWDSNISKVNNYLFPNSGVDLFEQEQYQSTGTYLNPPTIAGYSLAFFLKEAVDKQMTPSQIQTILPTTKLHWKSVTDKYNYTFDFNYNEDFLANDTTFFNCLQQLANSFQNQYITINYSFYQNETDDINSAYKFSDTYTSTFKLSELINGVGLESVNGATNNYFWFCIESCTYENSWSKYYNLENKTFSFDYSHCSSRNLYNVIKLKEVDAIYNLDDSLFVGQSKLYDPNNNEVVWTDDLFRDFVDSCKFFDTADLVQMLTNGQIDINSSEQTEQKLYGYSVKNINASMFCEIYPEWQPFFGTDVTKLVKGCTFSISDLSENIINVTITTNDNDTIVFDSSGWWNVEETVEINNDPTSFPDFSKITTDEFLKTVGNNPQVLMESYCRWYQSSPTEKYIFQSNLTQKEFFKDISNIDNPLIIKNDHDKNTILVSIKHHKYLNINNPSGTIVTENILLEGFKPWVPPPAPTPPIENPISIWLIVGLLGLGVVLSGAFIFIRIRIKRRSNRSMFNSNKKDAKQEPASLQDIMKSKKDKQEE